MDLPIPFDANGLGTVSMALQNRMMTLVAFLQAQNCSNLPGSWRRPATMLDFLRLRQVGNARPHRRRSKPHRTPCHSPAALRRVALVGDGWMPIALRPPSLLRPPEMADKMARLRRLLRDAGRAEDEVAISVTAPVVVTKTLASPRPLLHGTPGEIAGDLRQYQALGIRNFNVNLPGTDIAQQSEAIDQFMREVVPLVA
jgi:alkanesulfonate monooxygenase SsuD/methylene tetrahydromethanopterin reductase-like flavin-dependent oxidoreductase (luciferase family)